MESPIKMDDLGGKPTILGNPQVIKQLIGYTELRVATFPHIGTREHALSLQQPFSVAILDPQKGGFCEPKKPGSSSCM